VTTAESVLEAAHPSDAANVLPAGGWTKNRDGSVHEWMIHECTVLHGWHACSHGQNRWLHRELHSPWHAQHHAVCAWQTLGRPDVDGVGAPCVEANMNAKHAC
jgi:hypothetical protein